MPSFTLDSKEKIMKRKSKDPSVEDDISGTQCPGSRQSSTYHDDNWNQNTSNDLAEIASTTGYLKSSVHKILATLSNPRIRKPQRDDQARYRLELPVPCGQAALNNLHINNSAKAFLKNSPNTVEKLPIWPF